MKRNFTLSRRTMLGGAGALIALPWLEAMTPSAGRRVRAEPMVQPLRALFYYLPCGIHMPSWTPAIEGPNYELTKILAPLVDEPAMRDLKGDVMVLSGLENMPATPDGAGGHAGGTSAFLTCHTVPKTDVNYENAISIDQTIAEALKGSTPYASLQLGTNAGNLMGNCDSGYSCAYTSNISWANAKTPLTKLSSPKAIFDLMFGGSDPEATAEQLALRRTNRVNVIDYSNDEVKALQKKLGKTDRDKLDQYLTGLVELEKRIVDEDTGAICEVPAEYSGLWNNNFPTKVDLMTDLMVLALQCDQTRIITFMLENAGSNLPFDFIGVPDSHHQISHHMGLKENFDKLEKINAWEITQFAKLVQRLKSIPEGEGNLLDNTVVYLGSEISDGDKHNYTNMPVLLAGKLGGALTPGRHFKVPNKTPVSNLFISIANAMGVPITDFGDDGTAPLGGLKV